MGLLQQIIEGHINEFKSNVGIGDKEDEKVFRSRAKICSKCPMKSGNACNRKKYIDPQTKETFDKPGLGLIQGCGCRLSAKNKSKHASCPAGFWGGEFN